MKPKISIIVLSYNNEHSLRRCILSLLNQCHGIYSPEIIVVDAGSADHSIAILSNFSNQNKIKLILNSRHKVLSPGEGRNKGAEIARGEYLAFLDSDCIPEEIWIKRIFFQFERNNVEAIFFSRKPDQGKGIGTFYRRLYTVIYSRKFRFKDQILLSKEKIVKGGPFLMLAASNFVIKKRVWNAIGPMNTSFKDPAGEDVYIEIKLLNEGHVILFDPDNAVEHFHPLNLLDLLIKAFLQGQAIYLLRTAYKERFFKTKHALELREFIFNGVNYFFLSFIILGLPIQIHQKGIYFFLLIIILIKKRLIELKTQLKLILEIKNRDEYFHFRNISSFELLLFDGIDFLVKSSKLLGFFVEFKKSR